jgi:biopolymer transport protein ExbD
MQGGGDPYRTSSGPRRRRPKIHKKRESTIKPGGTKNDINVTPLVDVVLVLLIIFMVLTPKLDRKCKLQNTIHNND